MGCLWSIVFERPTDLACGFIPLIFKCGGGSGVLFFFPLTLSPLVVSRVFLEKNLKTFNSYKKIRKHNDITYRNGDLPLFFLSSAFFSWFVGAISWYRFMSNSLVERWTPLTGLTFKAIKQIKRLWYFVVDIIYINFTNS